MAKARAIVKRRKSVRNIRKITKTMQMIATAKFQKSLKRAVGGKPFTTKVLEIVDDLVLNVETTRHALMKRPADVPPVGRVALLVISSNRGLAGGYNGSVLRKAMSELRALEAAGAAVDLYVAGKKGASYFAFQKRHIAERFDQFADQPTFENVSALATRFMDFYTSGQVDAVHVVYMNFISTGVQRPAAIRLLPLAGAKEASEHLNQELAEGLTAAQRVGGGAGAVEVAEQERKLAQRGQFAGVKAARQQFETTTQYDYLPSPAALLEEMLPLTVRLSLYQAFLDATTSENVARMVAMKSATDNAEKMIKSLTMQYNRARQSQITTELSEIMGGVEAMKT
jgi:F-type H+-transporting ATPase subunit gamma